MNDTTLIELAPAAARPNLLGSLARRIVLDRLSLITEGGLTIREGAETLHFGSRTLGPNAAIDVLNPAFYAEVAYGGSVGAGESYMLGHWRTDNLTTALTVMLRNRHAMDALETGFAKVSAPLRVAAHWLHRNTRAGSRRNISAHYDLGNDFFRLFLDDTMMYSCAVFDRPDATLYQASVAKLDLICRKLDLKPTDHLVEIGTGWGGMAMHAARRYGCRVTTTTISPSQFELATSRIREAGLEDRITVIMKDYRDLEGTYDKLVSVEMIEAIGHQYFETFFRKCRSLLRDEGRMVLQSITIDDRHFERARDEVDFIKRYIFPGCCIPSVGSLTQASVCAGLRMEHLEDIGPHYATTLARWRETFFARIDEVRTLGYPEHFVRMWEFYLCYCEAGFAERSLGDVHMTFTAPR